MSIPAVLSQFGIQGQALIWGVMAALFVYGVLSLLAGYRLLKIMIFLFGFAVGTIVASYFTEGVVPVLAGLVTGAVCVVLWYLGIFLMGAGLMALVALALGVKNPTVLCLFGLLGGVLAIVIRKFIIIVSTSYSGASTLVCLGCGLFKSSPSEQVVLGMTFALTVVGIVVQYMSTKKLPVSAEKAVPASSDNPSKPE